MQYECEFKVGDLVEYRSWYDGDGGWVSITGMIGIVLEVIEISYDSGSYVFTEGDILYDVRVYWYTEAISEILPDMLLDHYDPNSRIRF